MLQINKTWSWNKTWWIIVFMQVRKLVLTVFYYHTSLLSLKQSIYHKMLTYPKWNWPKSVLLYMYTFIFKSKKLVDDYWVVPKIWNYLCPGQQHQPNRRNLSLFYFSNQFLSVFVVVVVVIFTLAGYNVLTY